MKRVEEGLMFETTGRIINPNQNIIGLSVNDETDYDCNEIPARVFQGSDRGLAFLEDSASVNKSSSPEEKRELAVHMMRRWAKYADIPERRVQIYDDPSKDGGLNTIEFFFDLDLSKEKG